MKIFESFSENDTLNIAREFAALLKGGDVVAFRGGMGMGKTVFTRGCVKALGNDSYVSSPTFAIVNDYGGKINLYHFDMYRVESWDSLYSTGFFDYMNDSSILFIEWSENIESVLPDNTIFVDFERGEDDNCRKITVSGGDGRW
ncbi:MAG: tRNA (adenosine(37)-N6)-threonylcarbamoyltransferase complex ATPase subunit type 1 TsaE [Clostridia bacterium]|nr:tRNA (adenosine(37)-N6)-threonylcarbamoyltransferase complex ATPase subunit type 1 TsaE [Clostridia bacterium]